MTQSPQTNAKGFSKAFWVSNTVELFERMAYYVVLKDRGVFYIFSLFIELNHIPHSLVMNTACILHSL